MTFFLSSEGLHALHFFVLSLSNMCLLVLVPKVLELDLMLVFLGGVLLSLGHFELLRDLGRFFLDLVEGFFDGLSVLSQFSILPLKVGGLAFNALGLLEELLSFIALLPLVHHDLLLSLLGCSPLGLSSRRCLKVELLLDIFRLLHLGGDYAIDLLLLRKQLLLSLINVLRGFAQFLVLLHELGEVLLLAIFAEFPLVLGEARRSCVHVIFVSTRGKVWHMLVVSRVVSIATRGVGTGRGGSSIKMLINLMLCIWIVGFVLVDVLALSVLLDELLWSVGWG